MAINLGGEKRAPLLKPCEGCGGTADYAYWDKGRRLIVARCCRCGRQTREWPNAGAAGDDWNRRITNGARPVTLKELSEVGFDALDDGGCAAVWIERPDESLEAALVCVGIDLGDMTVEVTTRTMWERWGPAEIRGEGCAWRMWDKRPTPEERAAAQWGGPAWREIRMIRTEEGMRLEKTPEAAGGSRDQ